ncbi:J domain-containing protein [Paenibacillus pasadenensis]|uniref:J domain-containing protein n=1 Tax=Paenibacillus pasadenensis TaxID=217090 RepID=UPI00203D8C27|nr:J domain-containing protein [Paenibacillus pasadenensis]MCM3748168.1 J domain-containing protein [Paenibacillus pasadenensis]
MDKEKIRQAYAELGLEADATKEEVEKKYDLLLRRARSHQKSSEAPRDGEVILERINAAYRTIQEQEHAETTEAFNEQAYGKYKGMAGTAQKVDHFFSYYKFHLLGAIVLIAAVIYGVNSYMDNQREKAELAKLPPAAVAVSFFGDFIGTDGSSPIGGGVSLTTAEEQIVKRLPDFKRAIVHLTYIPNDPKSGQDMALLQKSLIDLISNKDDVYIMDQVNFEKLARDNSLIDLGAHADKLGINTDDSRSVMFATTDDPTRKMFGVDVTKSPFIESMGFAGQKFIAAIRSDSQKVDNSLELIRAALSDTAAP